MGKLNTESNMQKNLWVGKTISSQQLFVLQWETIATEMSNAIKKIPLALGNIVTDFENMDSITPDRLELWKE